MAKKSKHKPIHPGPFGFMAGTVIEGSEAVTADTESWSESPSDPLGHDPKADETAGSDSANSTNS
jgi:hypothetical protein